MKPDFKNSIVNVSATISRFLGNDRKIPEIAVLKNELKKGYKNVVYMCLDGLGMFPLETNLPADSFLRKHVAKTITSVFPSTTTNATSSLCSASYPMDHGMFGWSLYIRGLDRIVDVYMGQDTITHESIDTDYINKLFHFDFYFDNPVDSEYSVCGIFPEYVNHTQNNVVYTTTDDMFSLADTVLKKLGKQFVYCYLGEPDSTMHRYGVTSKQAKNMIESLDKKIYELYKNNPDTLIIITPDHGQTDITDYLELYKDTALYSTLEVNPYLEARAASFRVKKGMEDSFLKEISKYKCLKVFRVRDMIDKNYFGPESERAEILGDYIAVVKNTHTQLVLHEKMTRFKGHHTALTKREMLLPLIIIKNEKTN